MDKLQEKSRQEQNKSKFHMTREILYGSLYEDSGKLLRGWYNAKTYYSLKSAEVSQYLSSVGRSIAKSYKNSALSSAVNASAKKIKQASLAVKNVTVKAVRAAVITPVKAVYKKTSTLAVNAAKRTGAFFKASGAWIRGRFSKVKKEKTAGEGAVNSAEKKPNIITRGFKAVGGAVKGTAKALTDNKAVNRVKAAAGYFKRKAAEIKGTLIAKYTDYKYENDRKSAIGKNRIHDMLREKKGGALYTEKLNNFRKELQNDKAVSSNLRLRANLERLRRNAGDMEKGNTGDVELAEISSDGTFKKEDPGMGMLQSLNEFDLGKALIKEDVNAVKSVPEDNSLVGTSAKETKKLSANAKKLKKIGKTGLKVMKTVEGVKKMTINGLDKTGVSKEVTGKIDIPVGDMGKAFNNIINIADDKQREKNMANLLTNVLDQAGKIVKHFKGDNSFSRITSDTNAGVSKMEQAKKDADNIERSKAAVNNIMNATKMLSNTLKEAKKSHKLLDQAVILKPVLTIINGVDTYNKLQRTNDKLNALTKEDLTLNITDKNVIRHMGQGKDMMIKQNKVKQTEAMTNAVYDASLAAAGILTGGAPVVKQIGNCLKKVSPIGYLVNQMKAKTDHEIMMEDAFGSMEKYEKIKAEHGLTKEEIESEILKMTDSATVKEYADRVRAETALHLHSRTVQAEKNMIENAATKLKEAGNIKGNSAQAIYKEMGGSTDYDKLMGRSKEEIHKAKIEEAKKKRNEERLKKEQSLQNGKKKTGRRMM